MNDQPESTYFPPDHPAINSAKEQVRAEALDLVRKADSVYMVAIVGDVCQSIAYGHPVLLPVCVQRETHAYLEAAEEMIERELDL